MIPIVKKRKKRKLKSMPIIEANNIKYASIQMDRSETNSREGIISVPEGASPDGHEGPYEIIFILATPGKELYKKDIDIRKLMESGESPILLPKGAEKLSVTFINNDDGLKYEITFYPNSNQQLAKANIHIDAKSFLHAEEFAYNLVNPLLSWWSYYFNVAIDISGYQITELITTSQKWVFNSLGQEKIFPLNSLGYISKDEYRSLLASYREGMNSSNPFYQFLCFYKVLEGIYNLRHKRIIEAKINGLDYSVPPERFPDIEVDISLIDPLGLHEFSKYKGQKFGRIKEDLEHILRNAIAHIDPTQDIKIYDNFNDITECSKAIPITRYMARTMLRNQFLADKDLSDKLPSSSE